MYNVGALFGICANYIYVVYLSTSPYQNLYTQWTHIIYQSVGIIMYNN